MKKTTLNELKRFNDVFRKDVTYDNIKSHTHKKKTGLHAFKNTFLEKAQGGAVFLGLSAVKSVVNMT